MKPNLLPRLSLIWPDSGTTSECIFMSKCKRGQGPLRLKLGGNNLIQSYHLFLLAQVNKKEGEGAKRVVVLMNNAVIVLELRWLLYS